MKRFSWMMGLVIGLSWLSLSGFAQADTNKFSVQAQLPSNQINRKVGYFDLKVKPKQTQRLIIKINNTDKVAHTYDLATNLAITGDSGTIVYSQQHPKVDSSLAFNITDATTTPAKVNVPARTIKRVTIRLSVPTKPFSGVALGGINVQQRLATDGKHKKAGVSLQNRFAYVIGLQLRETKKLSIKPNLKLLSAGPRQMNYRNYITAQLQNPKPVIIHDLKVTSYVTKTGQAKQLLKTSKAAMVMAPNSNFYFALGDGSKALQAGRYQLHLTADSKKGKYHWQFTKAFTIKANKANQLNQTAVTQPAPKPATNWWLIGGLIGIIVILLGLIGWLLIRNRKAKRQ